MKKLSPRVWLTLILVGLVGQFAWTIENMYFNVYLYNTISTDPGYISAMVGWSAAAATLTTLLMGALSDRVGKRKLFICGGYILWVNIKNNDSGLFGYLIFRESHLQSKTDNRNYNTSQINNTFDIVNYLRYSCDHLHSDNS